MGSVRASSIAICAAIALGSCGGGGSSAPPAAGPTPTPAPAPSPSPSPTPTQAEIDAAFEPVRDAARASVFADLVVMVGDRDGVIYTHEQGAITTSSVLATASAAKLLSGALIARLVERGAIAWEDRPQDHLGYWTSDPMDSRSRITLAQLAGFTSGFSASPAAGGCINDGSTTLALCAREFYEGGLADEPGETFYYGPAHLQVAGAMAEAATGETFAALFRREVTDPLGMPDTRFVAPGATNPRVAGGAQSTPRDYGKLLAAILGGGFIADLGSFTLDRTAGVAFGSRPAAASDGRDWHYATGAWIECDTAPFDPDCAREVILSSPGAFGWTPWIDFANGYWAMVATERRGPGSGSPAADSVALEQELQPLILAAFADLAGP